MYRRTAWLAVAVLSAVWAGAIIGAMTLLPGAKAPVDEATAGVPTSDPSVAEARVFSPLGTETAKQPVDEATPGTPTSDPSVAGARVWSPPGTDTAKQPVDERLPGVSTSEP